MAKIVIQMGHVGRKKGAVGTAGEQAFTSSAGNAAQSLLEASGHSVDLIPADVPDSSYRGDAFISIHADGSSNPSHSGASVGYRNSEGKDLAQRWKNNYVIAGWNRGFRNDNYTVNLSAYYGVRKAVAQGNKRACILEAGFLTNPDDKSLINADRMAIAIQGAVNEIFGISASIPMPPTVPIVAPSVDWFKERTKELQRLVGAGIDGIWGPETEGRCAANYIGWPSEVKRRNGRNINLPGNKNIPLVKWLQSQGERFGYPCTIDGKLGPQTNHLICITLKQDDAICGPDGFKNACR